MVIFLQLHFMRYNVLVNVEINVDFYVYNFADYQLNVDIVFNKKKTQFRLKFVIIIHTGHRATYISRVELPSEPTAFLIETLLFSLTDSQYDTLSD